MTHLAFLIVGDDLVLERAIVDEEILPLAFAVDISQRGINAINYLSEAKSQRSAAKGALVKGAFGVASTVLGGATQYSRMRPAPPRR